MFYTIYKTTNQVNGKIYIGKHQTKDLNDSYIGSGKMLGYAIEKYGIENFTKEILFIFDNETEMNAKEAELVTDEFVLENTNYNLCPGGKGGWGYLNTNNLSVNTFMDREIAKSAAIKANITKNNLLQNEEWRTTYSNNMSNATKGELNGMFGKKHSDETKKKMSGPRGKYNVNKTGIKRGPYKKKTINADVP